MKNLLILLFLIIPLSIQAANTNAFDNVKVNNSFTAGGTILQVPERVLGGTWTNRGSFVVMTNLTFRGGLIVQRRSVSVPGYTNLSNDYMISYTALTAGAVTNYLPTGLQNGQTFIIKDGTRSAFSTNIFVIPLGSDTLMGTNRFIINQNSQSITITYDGTSNWEFN